MRECGGGFIPSSGLFSGDDCPAAGPWLHRSLAAPEMQLLQIDRGFSLIRCDNCAMDRARELIRAMDELRAAERERQALPRGSAAYDRAVRAEADADRRFWDVIREPGVDGDDWDTEVAS